MRAVLLAIAGAGFASATSMRMLDPVLPAIAREFGRTIDETALLTVAFTAAYALAQPVLGPLGDSLGKARMIGASVLLLSVTGLLAAASRQFETLTLVRTVAGACAGGIIPLCLAAYGDLVPVGERQVALARLMVATVSGQIVGSTLAGLLADAIGWRGVLVVGSAVGLAAAAGIAVTARRAGSMPRKPLSFRGALDGYAAVFRNPIARPLIALVAAEGLLVYGLFPYIAAILEHRSGAGAFEAGLVIGGFALGGLAYGVTARLVVTRLGQAVMAPAGGVLMALGMAVFAAPLPWWVMIGAFAVHGFGFYLIHSTLQTHATEVAPAARGSALAVFASALFVGVACGPLAFGFVNGLAGDSLALVLVAALLLGLGLSVPRLLRLER